MKKSYRLGECHHARHHEF